MSKRYSVDGKEVHVSRVSSFRQLVASFKCVRSGGHYWKFHEESFDVNTTLKPMSTSIYICQNPNCRLMGYIYN